MGVLVGTALIVIIPEGVETLYSANEVGNVHVRRGVPSHSTRSSIEAIPQLDLLRRGPKVQLSEDDSVANALKAAPGPVVPPGLSPASGKTMAGDAPPQTPTTPGVVGVLGDGQEKPPAAPAGSVKHSHSESHHEPHAWIGLSLILGFILMYLLDTLPLLTQSTPTHSHNNIYSLSDLSSSPVPTAQAPPQRSLSTTLGLCIHAAADGIALGASSASTATASLSLIIFVAIMVHKAPAAFGLTSVLLKQGLGKRMARAHLVIFSLAAPAGALCTWIIVRALGGGAQGEPALMKWWTGVLLLFSGGTFL